MMPPDDKKLLLNYLNPTQPFEYRGTKRHSTLIAGLRDCRQLLNRNLETGEQMRGTPSAVWLAAIGYFSILDQIGSIFKNVDGTPLASNKNSIVYALENFASLDDFMVTTEERERVILALKALRNSFTHDFNLLNVPTRQKSLERHKFTIISDSTEPNLVILPARSWDGDIDGKDFYATDDSTIINLFQFAELVESVYKKIFTGVTNDTIETSFSVHKTLNKYTFVTSSHPLRD